MPDSAWTNIKFAGPFDHVCQPAGGQDGGEKESEIPEKTEGQGNKPRPGRAARAETLPGERIGVVTHYFSHLSVAVLKLDPGAMLRVGDRIHIKGHTTDFGQRVDSLQVEHQPVMQVGPADDFGLKVTDHAREHDIVYRVL
jgi:putative protease